MKKIIVAVLALGMLSSGCKIFQRVNKDEEPVTESIQDNTQPKVFSVPGTKSDIKEETEKPVRTQSETFSFDRAEDQSKNENKSYFVIIGSFSSNENANRYKQELTPKGFSPIVLHSETGYYRVCVNSFSEESEARKRVYEIRNNYPQYADTWLLIKK